MLNKKMPCPFLIVIQLDYLIQSVQTVDIMRNSADPDQLASTPFAKAGHIRVQQVKDEYFWTFFSYLSINTYVVGTH